MEIPADLRYTKEHEWVRVEDGIVSVGITDYAQGELGEIVYLDLPEAGETCTAGNVFGAIEAVKTVADLYSPVTGEIIEVNEDLSDRPELVNEDPFGKGWMVKIKATDLSELEALLEADGYREMISS